MSDTVAVPELQKIVIPTDVNVIAKYLIAPLADSKKFALSNEFIEYVLSPEGQAILAKWGFTPVTP
jgi:molybdate transport system substrate-binding protein